MLACSPALATPAGALQTLQPTQACVQPAGASDCQAIAPALPFRWDLVHSAQDGSARFVFAFARPAGDDPPLSLLLARAGNGIEVQLNGREVFAIGAAGTQRHDAVKRPWLVPLPATLLAADNQLVVTIHAAMGRAAQLHAPVLGPHAAVQTAFDRHYLWRVEVTRALMWMSLMLGAMSLLVWWVQREALFLACGLAELAWATRLAEMFWIDMPLDWQLWGTGVATVFGLTQLAMTNFFLRAVGRWNRFFRRAYIVFIAAWCVVVPVVVLLRWRDLWVGWLFGVTLMFLLLAVYVGINAFRERHFWRWLFAGWVVASVAGGIADLTESAGSMYSHPTWSRLVTAAFSLAMVVLVARRLQHARRADQQRQLALQQALQRQQTELELLHRGQARAQLDRAMQDERERVMRDMHDGLGAQLSGLLALTERPGSPAAELQPQVRSAIDELRLVVDAMSPFDGNLSTMLGSLRPQLERRLALSRIDLRWDVDELPATPDLTPARVQHLRRLLLEAATNVARHAGATEAVLSARMHDDRLELRLADNGRGFDAAAPHAGNGLRNMRWRAQALGGEISFASASGGCVTLSLRPAAAPGTAPG
ncbi:MAG: ATP-binding protein [Aquabacterium sp.]